LSPAETYKLYLSVLPKKKVYSKYVKSKKASKYNSDLLELLSKHFMVSELEIQDYLDILTKEQVTDIIKKYGKNEKEVDKLLAKPK
jgi:hypothetical protein